MEVSFCLYLTIQGIKNCSNSHEYTYNICWVFLSDVFISSSLKNHVQTSQLKWWWLGPGRGGGSSIHQTCFPADSWPPPNSSSLIVVTINLIHPGKDNVLEQGPLLQDLILVSLSRGADCEIEGPTDIQIMEPLVHLCFQACSVRVDDLQWTDLCRKSLRPPLLQSFGARPTSLCSTNNNTNHVFIYLFFFFEEEGERISVLHLGIQLSLGSASLLLPQHFLDILPSPFHLFLMVGVEDSKSFGISEVLKEARQEFTSWKKLQCGQNNHYLNPKSLTTDQVHRTFCLVALPQIAFLKVVITMSTLPSAIGTRSRNWLKTCPS